MSAINRLLIIVLALALGVLGLALLLVPASVFATADNLLSSARSAQQTSLLIGGVAMVALALLALMGEVWPRRTSTDFESRANGGTVVYPPEAVASAIERELAAVDGVRFAKAEVSGHGRSVATHLNLVIDPAYDPQETAQRAVHSVREKVERGLGLKLQHPRISIQQAEPADARAFKTAADVAGHESSVSPGRTGTVPEGIPWRG